MLDVTGRGAMRLRKEIGAVGGQAGMLASGSLKRREMLDRDVVLDNGGGRNKTGPLHGMAAGSSGGSCGVPVPVYVFRRSFELVYGWLRLVLLEGTYAVTSGWVRMVGRPGRSVQWEAMCVMLKDVWGLIYGTCPLIRVISKYLERYVDGEFVGGGANSSLSKSTCMRARR